MERQTIILLPIIFTLLVASQGMNFADESIPVRQPIRDKLARAARHFLGVAISLGRDVGASRHGLLRVCQSAFCHVTD